jgi:hypothetical protein
MKIVFHTKNIDKVFYRQVILQYIADHLKNPIAANQFKKYEKNWTFNIHPVTDWEGIDGRSGNTGTLNKMIPHGVTGEGVVKTYVIDVDDKGLTSLQNFSAVLHEVAHMLLIMMMRGQRGILRNDDLSGNKKGKEMNISTQEVHDRQMEKKLYQFQTYINVGNWIKRKYIRYTAIGIDLRDFLETSL